MTAALVSTRPDGSNRVVQRMRRILIRVLKPLVGDAMWQRLRLRHEKISRSRVLQPSQRKLDSMDLTQLARHFGTDKAGTHRYTQHYERHLGHLRGNAFTLLEIGIGGYSLEKQGGASLRMWSQYFPDAQIVGLDIEDKSFVDAPRTRTYQGSQVDQAILEQIFQDYTDVRVVIDDGSHRPEHIRETFALLFPKLPDDGIYVIEDTQTSYWPEWGGSEDRFARDTTMALVKDLIDGLNYEEYVDESYQPTYSDLHVVGVHAYHNLVVIEKGDNREGTNRREVLRNRYSGGPARQQ